MEQDQSVQEFLKLLTENGREGQAKDLSALMFYMDGMERQYNAVLKELQEVKKQLAQMNERPSPAKKALTGILAKLEARLDALHERISDIREKIVSVAKDAVENFKQAGVSALDKAVSALHFKPALDKAVSALHFKPALENIQSGLQKCVSEASAAVERGERMGAELRSARRHIKNALYAAIGKKPPSHLGDAGRFQTVVLAPVRGMRSLLSRMNNNALGAISAVERLEQAAEQSREARAEKKTSIRAELEEMKKESAARAMSAKDREHEPKEVEL